MSTSGFHIIQTADPKMRQILKMAENIALSRASVLISGESGTGKELLARFIHSKSSRALKKFHAINCAAVPEGLLESELFGYEKGAFTGADNKKPGRFEQAHDSTFLLDEISEMPLLLQAKLLRVLQEGEVERLGGTASVRVNVRVIATTNRNLQQMVSAGSFREDLYYRLNVIPIEIPPLRMRPKDIELLSRLFVDASCAENSIASKQLCDSALAKLLSWSWPGNVRELQNVLERSALLCTEQNMQSEHILINNYVAPSEPALGPGMTVGEAEKLLIMKTLEFTEQNRTKAAQMLGISIRTLRNKLNEYKEGVVV